MKIDNASHKSIANDTGAVQFPCPNCLQETVVRSLHARQIASRYTCPNCGFTGPN